MAEPVYSDSDNKTLAQLAIALERFDNAWGVPFGAGPLRARVKSWLPACRGLPEQAVIWAVDVALASLEKYPVPAQLRKLAQASPAYTTLQESRKPAKDTDAPQLLCNHCGEPRAQHRITLYDGAPRPIVVGAIRHRPGCVMEPSEVPVWTDAPAYGLLGEGAEAWRVVGVEWDAPPRRGEEAEKAPRAGPTAPVSTIGGAEMPEQDLKAKAAGYRQAARDNT